jgi:pyruvate,orthophosphate dikinase
MLLDELKALGQSDDTRVGARLTPAGRTRADAILAAERADVDTATVGRENERFTPVNSAFKHLITRWQMREVDGKQGRNDHSDTAYDAVVLAELDAVHRDVGDIVAGIAGAVARFGAYRSRLDAALEKVRSGDLRYLVAPDVESYHTIWFELHQDLIGLSGTTRAKEAAAGRAL